MLWVLGVFFPVPALGVHVGVYPFGSTLTGFVLLVVAQLGVTAFALHVLRGAPVRTGGPAAIRLDRRGAADGRRRGPVRASRGGTGSS